MPTVRTHPSLTPNGFMPAEPFLQRDFICGTCQLWIGLINENSNPEEAPGALIFNLIPVLTESYNSTNIGSFSLFCSVSDPLLTSIGHFFCENMAVVEVDCIGEGSCCIWADVFDCQGKETHLSQCNISSWSRAACSHKHDAGVICNGEILTSPTPR